MLLDGLEKHLFWEIIGLCGYFQFYSNSLNTLININYLISLVFSNISYIFDTCRVLVGPLDTWRVDCELDWSNSWHEVCRLLWNAHIPLERLQANKIIQWKSKPKYSAIYTSKTRQVYMGYNIKSKKLCCCSSFTLVDLAMWIKWLLSQVSIMDTRESLD